MKKALNSPNHKDNDFSGVWTALVTPFTASGKIDLEAYQKLLEFQKKSGVAGVIPCGTTGESPTLTLEEKKLLITTTVAFFKKSSVRVLAGTGSNNTQETVQFSKWACDAGVAGLLVVTPYYNKPQPAGLEAHFLAIANAVTCPIMLYQVPGRTGVRFTIDTLLTLARHPRIRALKEASADATWTSELRGALLRAKLNLQILSGDDPTYLPYLAIGAVGTVSVASNIIPRQMVELTEANRSRALKLHQEYSELFRNIFIESNPVPVKQALAWMNYCRRDVRLPLAPMTDKNAATLKDTLIRCGVLKK